MRYGDKERKISSKVLGEYARLLIVEEIMTPRTALTMACVGNCESPMPFGCRGHHANL